MVLLSLGCLALLFAIDLASLFRLYIEAANLSPAVGARLDSRTVTGMKVHTAFSCLPPCLSALPLLHLDGFYC